MMAVMPWSAISTLSNRAYAATTNCPLRCASDQCQGYRPISWLSALSFGARWETRTGWNGNTCHVQSVSGSGVADLKMSKASCISCHQLLLAPSPRRRLGRRTAA